MERYVWLHDDYQTGVLTIDFTSEQSTDLRVVKKGEELLADAVEFKYMVGEKVKARITLSFQLVKGESITKLEKASVVSGYAHKKYKKELEQVINKFLNTKVELEIINFIEKIKNGESFIAGFKNQGDKSEVTVQILKDVPLKNTFAQYRRFENPWYFYNGAIFQYFKLEDLNPYIRVHLHNDHQPIIIKKDGKHYAAIAYVSSTMPGQVDENKNEDEEEEGTSLINNPHFPW